MKMKNVFTTGEIAKLCQVASRSVSKWIDSGELKGYRLPGSNDRRVPRENLLAFLRQHGMPTNGLEEHRPLVLLIGSGNWSGCQLPELLGTVDFAFQALDNGFDAGIVYRERKPAVVVIDIALGRLESLHIANGIAHDLSNQGILLLGLAPEDELDPERLMVHGFKVVWKKPVNPADVAETIRRHFNPEPVARPKVKRGRPVVTAA